MSEHIVINIALDFTDAPGARYRQDGPKSGEEFYEELLLPKFKEAQSNGVKICIVFDGAWGYATSFISEAFGRLSEKFDSKSVLERIDFISEEDPFLIEYVKRVIKDPNQNG